MSLSNNRGKIYGSTHASCITSLVSWPLDYHSASHKSLLELKWAKATFVPLCCSYISGAETLWLGTLSFYCLSQNTGVVFHSKRFYIIKSTVTFCFVPTDVVETRKGCVWIDLSENHGSVPERIRIAVSRTGAASDRTRIALSRTDAASERTRIAVSRTDVRENTDSTDTDRRGVRENTDSIVTDQCQKEDG